MTTARKSLKLSELRQEVVRLEGDSARERAVLPFGIEPLDRRLMQGGLPLGCLNEVAGGGDGAVDGATASCFIAGIASRLPGTILWCMQRDDLFAPGLQ